MKCTKVLRQVTLSVLFLFLCLSFCPKEAMAAGIKLNKTAITLCRYHEYKLKVTGTKQKVKWKSSNKIVASVNQKGVVKANEAESFHIFSASTQTMPENQKQHRACEKMRLLLPPPETCSRQNTHG